MRAGLAQSLWEKIGLEQKRREQATKEQTEAQLCYYGNEFPIRNYPIIRVSMTTQNDSCE